MNTDQLRLLLPDYVAGTLSEQERALVEAALAQSPELRSELEDIAVVFAAFPAKQLRQELDWRARTISAAVSQHLGAAAVPRRVWWRLAAGAMAAGALAVWAMVGLQKHDQPPLPSAVALNQKVAPVQQTATTDTHAPASSLPQAQPHPKSYPDAAVQRHDSVMARLTLDALAMATFPDDAIDSQFVEHFVEVFSDASTY